MRISDWSSDVCSSDLVVHCNKRPALPYWAALRLSLMMTVLAPTPLLTAITRPMQFFRRGRRCKARDGDWKRWLRQGTRPIIFALASPRKKRFSRSEEHTSELQSLMRTPYAVICLDKKK